MISAFISTWNMARILLLSLALVLGACGGGGGSSAKGPSSISVSGKITVASDSDVDVDLNILQALNNDADDPQFINNPATIGGYLSGYAGHYESGSAFNVDLADYFEASLVEGQEIKLSLFEAHPALSQLEASVLLLAVEGESDLLVEQINLNDARFASLMVPTTGLFKIGITVVQNSDPLLYTLSISQTIASQNSIQSGHKAFSDKQWQSLQHDFVPGEVLIQFKTVKEDALLEAAATSHTKAKQSSIDKFEQDHSLVLHKHIPDVAHLYRISDDGLQNAFRLNKSSNEPQLAELEQKLQTLALINQLKDSAQIAFAEPNYLYRTTASKNDPRLTDQWNLPMIAVQSAWEVSSGNNVIVAVLDTGIDATHEDLQHAILADGFDFISSSVSSGDGDGFDANPNDEGSSFHGSHVAGIIAAQADNAKGIAGIAHGASLMPLRVLGIQDTGNTSDIAQAVLYAARLNNSANVLPAQAAHIINMSFGSEARSETLKAALDKAYEAGLILIAAAGNASSDVPFYPAAFGNVIGVGSVSSEKNISSFSNYGINVQIVAPGGSGSGNTDFDGFEDAILSTVRANNYAEFAGTSMAAPHVSAVAALMKELKTDLNAQSFKQVLESGVISETVNPGIQDIHNFYGAGLINAAQAVNWAAGSTIIPPILSVYPAQFGFIGGRSRAVLNLRNFGSASLAIDAVTSSVDWMNITRLEVDNQTGLGQYEIEIRPQSPAIGQGEIVIGYQINNAPVQTETLKVFISRLLQTDATVGTLFVSLFREEDILNDNFVPMVTVGGQLNNGRYHYCFPDVPSGRYQLTASTDNDRDQLSFDRGEAVGSYPLTSRPAFIEVGNASLSNINFDIQFSSFVSSSESLASTARISSKPDILMSKLEQGVLINPAQVFSQNACQP